MLQKIKRFFDNNLISNASSSSFDNEHAVRLAMASLMIEVAESDYHDAPEERESVLNIVKSSFDLSDTETNEIVDLARQEHVDSIDYFQFTSLINQHYSAAQRIELIEKLWQIAFADHKLDKHEEHVIRRIADLIHVAHSDFMKTKLKVQNSVQP